MTCEIFGNTCEGIGAIGSVLVASLAFGVTIWHAWTTRKHNRLSVKPLLNTWNDFGSFADGLEITLRNIGIGPALIESFEIYVDAKKVDGIGTDPINKAISILFPVNTPTILYSSYLAKGGVLGVNEKIKVLSIKFPPNFFPSPPIMEHTLNRCKLIVRYQSIYENEVFTYDSLENHKD